MLEQTKHAIKSLKASGFNRHEISVRVNLLTSGYGDPRIVLYCSTSRAIALTPDMLANGLSVTHWEIDGMVRHVSVYADGRNQFELIQVEKGSVTC